MTIKTLTQSKIPVSIPKIIGIVIITMIASRMFFYRTVTEIQVKKVIKPIIHTVITQSNDTTALNNWRNLKIVDDSAFNYYISQNSWCLTIQGDKSAGDLTAMQEDQQSASSESKELFALNYKRRDLLKVLGYSNTDSQTVMMNGLQY